MIFFAPLRLCVKSFSLSYKVLDRIRQRPYYPFPAKSLRKTLASYPNANQLVWAQEEPQNMGGWTFVQDRLENILPSCERPQYVGRSASASPATGSYSIHQKEQAELVAAALKTT